MGSIKPNVEDMLTVMISNYKEELHIERKRLNILDIMATAGGFASIILLVTRNFSRMYASLLFEEKLVKGLCKVDYNQNI